MANEISKKVDAYLEKFPKWKDGMHTIREIMLATELEEEVKWGMPTYRINGKNVVSFAGFKNHYGVWFHQGAFLKDEHKLLENAQEGKTRGMRHLKYSAGDVINQQVLAAYIDEAIQNQKDGKEIKVQRTKKTLEVSAAMKEHLSSDALGILETFSMSKRNEYIEYIDTAKRESTKMSRLAKIEPMILDGKGLNDMYRK